MISEKIIENTSGLVSVIIPCHNDAFFLQGLLCSLEKVLCNENFSYEIFVVNNASVDDTSKIISSFNVKEILVERKLNPSEARNLGVANCNGDLLVFLDSDVVVTKEWATALRKKVSDWCTYKCSFLTGDYYHISQKPSWIEKAWFSHIYDKDHEYICGGNIIVDRETFTKVEGFNELYETGEDVHFSKKCRELSVPFVVDKGFYVYHEGYPKSIRSFLKRERWHGKSDFLNLKSLINSKVAVITVVFIILHFLLPLSLFIGYDFLFLNIFLIISVSVLNYLNKKPSLSFHNFIRGIFISYCYFVGRAWSAFSQLIAKF